MNDADPVLATSQWTVVSEWDSFLAHFIHVRSDGGLDVAVKFGTGWAPEDAEFVAAEIARVRRLFAELPGGSVEVPPVLGWCPDPAAIVLPFITGENLFAALSDPRSPLRSDDERLRTIMHAAGEALGAYHAAEEAPDDAATRAQAHQDVAAAVRKSGYPGSLVKRLETETPLVRAYRLSHNDFTLADRSDQGSGLVMLDPPHVRKFDHLHRDLSAFTLALRRAITGDRHASQSDERWRRYARLRDDVIAGYQNTGPAKLDTDFDEWLLWFYEQSRIGSQLVGRLRSRQVRASMRSMAWWMRDRIALGSPPDG